MDAYGAYRQMKVIAVVSSAARLHTAFRPFPPKWRAEKQHYCEIKDQIHSALFGSGSFVKASQSSGCMVTSGLLSHLSKNVQRQE